MGGVDVERRSRHDVLMLGYGASGVNHKNLRDDVGFSAERDKGCTRDAVEANQFSARIPRIARDD